MADEPVVWLLVCGTLDRVDDGAALRAIELLLPSLREAGRRGVEVRYCGQLDVDHLLELPDGAPIVLVDAASGVPAGEIVVRTFDELIDRARTGAPRSSHALPIDQVLGIARVFAEAPMNGTFVGIGGADFGLGTDLSAAVEQALPEFVAAISDAIHAALSGEHVRGGEPVGARGR